MKGRLVETGGEMERKGGFMRASGNFLRLDTLLGVGEKRGSM